MKNRQLDELQLSVTQMITSEQQEHASLLAQIHSRSPSDKDSIIDNLSVVHNTRIDVLEQVLEIVRRMKAKK